MVLDSNPAAATSLRNFFRLPRFASVFRRRHKSHLFFLSGISATGSKRSHQSALEMCNLSWTPSLLEKDNSKNNPVFECFTVSEGTERISLPTTSCRLVWLNVLIVFAVPYSTCILLVLLIFLYQKLWILVVVQ